MHISWFSDVILILQVFREHPWNQYRSLCHEKNAAVSMLRWSNGGTASEFTPVINGHCPVINLITSHLDTSGIWAYISLIKWDEPPLFLNENPTHIL